MRFPTRSRCSLSGGVIYEGDALYVGLCRREEVHHTKVFGSLHEAEAYNEFSIAVTGKIDPLYIKYGVCNKDGEIPHESHFYEISLNEDTKYTYRNARLVIVRQEAAHLIFNKQMDKYNLLIEEMYESICQVWLKHFDMDLEPFKRRWQLLLSGALGVSSTRNYDRWFVLKCITECSNEKIMNFSTPEPYLDYTYEPPTIEEIKHMVLFGLMADFFDRMVIFPKYCYLGEGNRRSNKELLKNLRLIIKSLKEA